MKLGAKILLLLVIMSILLFYSNQGNSTNGDSFGTAINLPLDQIASGYLANGASIYYNVTINATGDYSFNLTTSSSNTFQFFIYNSNKVLILSSNYESYPLVDAISLSTGYYYVQVYASSGSGNFLFCGTNAVQGQLISNPIPLPLNLTLEGTSHYDSYFNVSIIKPGYYKFNISSAPTSFYVILLTDLLGNPIKSPNIFSYPENIVANLTPGLYYLSVTFYSGLDPFYISAVPYIIHPGEDFANAIQVPMNTTENGTIPYSMYYNFSIIKPGYYDFNFNTSVLNAISFGIYKPGYGFIAGSSLDAYTKHVAWNLSAGNYYIQMDFYSIAYSFNFRISPYSIHPGEDLSHAVLLTLNTNITGTIPYNYYYNFTITNPGYYKFLLTSGKLFSFGLYQVYYIPGYNYYNQIDFSTGTPSTLIENLQPGTYFLEVFPNNYIGSFNVSYTSYIPQPGEALSTALTLPIGTSVGAKMPSQAFFNFTINNTGAYFFQLSAPLSATLNFQIVDSKGNTLAYSRYSSYPIWTNVTLISGSYYIHVFGSGIFSLIFQRTGTFSTTTSQTNSSSNTSPTTTTSNKNLISFAPFSPIEIILSSFVILGIGNVYRRRGKKP